MPADQPWRQERLRCREFRRCLSRPRGRMTPTKVTAYFRDVVRAKHPGIEEAWILRVMAKPLEERRQPDGRYALW